MLHQTRTQGRKGRWGKRGVKGDQGDQGPPGIQGSQGERGQLGYPGYKGQKGDIGDKVTLIQKVPTLDGVVMTVYLELWHCIVVEQLVPSGM